MKLSTGYGLKSVLVVFIFILSIKSTSSQIRFGVRGGYDLVESKISNSMLNSKNRLGFQLGLTSNISIPLLGLGVDASVLYGHKKYDNKDKGSGARESGISNFSYIHIPVNLKKSFSVAGLFGVFINGGVYGDVKLNGGSFKLSQIEDVYDEYKSKNFQFGLNGGFGVSFLHNFEIGLNYRYRLTDNYSDADIDYVKELGKRQNKTGSIKLTYYFH